MNRAKSKESEKQLAKSIKRSIADIILTPLGSRPMRRNYGTQVFFLLDNPINDWLISQLQAEIINSINLFEPRVNVNKVIVETQNSWKMKNPKEILNSEKINHSKLIASIDCTIKETNKPLNISSLEIKQR